jgi:hypothetical protein
VVRERTWKCWKWTRKELDTKVGKYYVGIEDIIFRRKKYNGEKRRPQGQVTKDFGMNSCSKFFFIDIKYSLTHVSTWCSLCIGMFVIMNC